MSERMVLSLRNPWMNVHLHLLCEQWWPRLKCHPIFGYYYYVSVYLSVELLCASVILPQL